MFASLRLPGSVDSVYERGSSSQHVDPERREVGVVIGSLSDKVAVVTGASRGLGKGIALGLGEAGATVYVTGRSTNESRASLPGTIDETAAEVTRLGGRGIAAPCDHRVDSDVEALFSRVRSEQRRLDLLVNNAFASPEQRLLWGGQRFWEISLSLWDDLIDVGLRSHFVASWHAAPIMIEQGRGLIINVASHGAGRGKSPSSRVDPPVLGVQGGLASIERRHGRGAARHGGSGGRFHLAAGVENGGRACPA
jgi:NAD(P)-dependent dehydrogenase (short-subunit alcohol dehydrogenase family)